MNGKICNLKFQVLHPCAFILHPFPSAPANWAGGDNVSPQKMQYWSWRSGYAPHLGQRRTCATSCTPQCMQNWSYASTSLRQDGQRCIPAASNSPAAACPARTLGRSGGGDIAVGPPSAARKSSAEANRLSSREY